MRLALFDLDNTLLAGDSDLLWGELLARHGAMDVERVRRFHDDYHAGTLDIEAFFDFQLAPLARHPREQLELWRDQFMEELIRPRIAPAARELVEYHRAQGHELAIITATNRFITTPIAHEFGIEHLIATEPEEQDGRFTGRVSGVACYRTGKLVHLNHWLCTHGLERGDLAETWFYSDSHNDLPLLSAVEHPVAVDPCPRLLEIALSRGWVVMECTGKTASGETTFM
ncbi:MAG: HAD family hydrolase [Planctomycetes bacterium]|nr:HAD family hydrolase [Planctomycetota bacterium]